MLTNFRIITIIINYILLVGCAGDGIIIYPEYTEKKEIMAEEIPNERNALIVAKISATYVDLYNKTGYYPGFMILQSETDPMLKYSIDCSSYIISTTVIKPGTYYIQEYNWSDGAYKMSVHPYLKITAKPGDRIYYGDIIINSLGKKINISKRNNLSIVKKDLDNTNLKMFKNNLKFYK